MNHNHNLPPTNDPMEQLADKHAEEFSALGQRGDVLLEVMLLINEAFAVANLTKEEGVMLARMTTEMANAAPK